MRRKSSCSWPLLTSGLRQEQIWWTSDQMSSNNNTPARSNVKWGHNETKSLLEVLENRLKGKGMICVSPGNEKIVDQVNYKSNTAISDKHIEARMKLLRHAYEYRGKDIPSVRSLQAISEADWNKLLHAFRHVRSKRGTSGAATNSQATSKAKTGAPVAGAAATNSQAEHSLEGNSVGSPTHDTMRLFKEAHEKLQRASLPPELFAFAAAGILDEHFLVSLMSTPDESVFKFVNNRMEAFCNKGEDFV